MSKVAETHKALGPRQLESEESIEIEQSRAKRAADGARIEDFTIEDTPYAFVVKGTAVERFCQMTNWDYFESYKRFARVLKMSGIEKALKEAAPARVIAFLVGKFEFAWSNDHREKTLYTTWKERRDEKPGTQQGSRHWPHLCKLYLNIFFVGCIFVNIITTRVVVNASWYQLVPYIIKTTHATTKTNSFKLFFLLLKVLVVDELVVNTIGAPFSFV